MAKVTCVMMDVVTENSGHQVVPNAVSVCLTPCAPAPVPIPYPVICSVSEGIGDPPMRTKFNGVDYPPRQALQQVLIRLAKRSRVTVENAHGANSVAARNDQWRTCVEANVWVTDDQRVVGESWIGGHIGNNKGLARFHHMRAKGVVSGESWNVEPDAALVP